MNTCESTFKKTFRNEIVSMFNRIQSVEDFKTNIKSTIPPELNISNQEKAEIIISQINKPTTLRRNKQLKAELQQFAKDVSAIIGLITDSNIEGLQEIEENDKSDHPEEIKYNSYLRTYFPYSDNNRSFFKNWIKTKIIRTMFINDWDSTPSLITSSEDFNKGLWNLKINLIRSIIDGVAENAVLPAYNIPDLDSVTNYSTLQQSLDLIFNDIELYAKQLNPSSSIILETNQAQKNINEGYLAYVAYKNFDEVLKDNFSKLIGQDSNNEYFIKLGDNNVHSWSGQGEDRDQTAEIGSAIVYFVESMYKVDKNFNITNNLLSFTDFKRLLGAIQEQSSNNNYLRLSLTDDALLKEYYGEQGWISMQSLLKDITIGDFILMAKGDPSKWAPLVYYAIANNKITLSNDNDVITAKTIWKNIYDFNNDASLVKMSKYSRNPTLLDFFSTIFVNIENTPFSQYEEEDDSSLASVQLSQNRASSTLKAFTRQLSSKYDREVPWCIQVDQKDNVGTRYRSARGTYTLEVTTNEDGPFTISINIGDRYTITNVHMSVADGKLVIPTKQIMITDHQSNEEKPLNLFETSEFAYFTNFFNEVFGKTFNPEFYNQRVASYMPIAVSILYNALIGKQLQAAGVNTMTKYNSVINEYYLGKNKTPVQFIDPTQSENAENNEKFQVKTMLNSVQPVLYPDTLFPKINNLNRDIDNYTGRDVKLTEKDSEGKTISIVGLSALLPKIREQWRFNTQDQESPLANFTLYKLFKGSEFMRAYKDAFQSKAATQFSSAEFYLASLLIDFYETQDKGNSKIIKIMGPVVSDKNKLVKLLIDTGDVDITVENGETKKLKDLNSEDIIWLINKEFGDYYLKQLQTIINDYQIISNIANNDAIRVKYSALLSKYNLENITVNFDYLNNFEDLNKLVEQFKLNGTSLEQFQHDLIWIAQQEGVRVDITEEVYYKTAKDGTFSNNPATFYNLAIYNKISQADYGSNTGMIGNVPFKTSENLGYWQDYYTDMQYQLFTEIAQDVRSINLQKNGKLRPNLSHLTGADGEWATNNKHYLYFAKIHFGDKTINISSPRSLEIWGLYKFIGMNISDPSFNAYDFMQALNSRAKNYVIYNYFYKIFGYKDKNYSVDIPKSYVSSINSEFKLDYIGFKQAEYKSKLESLIQRYQILKQKQIDGLIDANVESALNALREFVGNENLSESEIGSINANEVITEKAKEDFKRYSEGKTVYDKLKYLIKYELITPNSKIDKWVKGLAEKAKDSFSENNRALYDADSITLELNPEIWRHNLLNFWLGESYDLSSIGTASAHPSKGRKNKTMPGLVSAMFNNKTKRQVTQTAAKHREVQNSLNGIAKDMKIAIIKDIKNGAYTFSGYRGAGAIKVVDGATFQNGVINKLDNNSLGADAMGTDKKCFGSNLSSKTGIGFILKTAGFICNNERIKNSENIDAVLNKHMNNSITWSSVINTPNRTYTTSGRYSPTTVQNTQIQGTKILVNGRAYLDWTVNYKGDNVFQPETADGNADYIYLYKDGLWRKRYDFHVADNGLTFFKEEIANDEGIFSPNPIDVITVAIVPEGFTGTNIMYKGEPINLDETIINKENDLGIIDSNWQLWNYVFGGAWSGHLNSEGNPTYDNDDSSFNNLVKVVNTPYELLYNHELRSQDDCRQFAKEAMISMMPTEGAVKFGAVNINGTNAYNNPDYNITYMTISAMDFGEQLDAEHTADDSQVSMTTQVLNALGARGYTAYQASEIYQAIYQVCLDMFKPAFDSINDPKAFRNEVAKLIGNSILKVKDTDGSILNALAQHVKTLNPKDFTDASLEGVFPISNPAIFKKIISDVAVALEPAIRLKLKGSLAVLNPSDGRFKMIGNRQSGYYNIHPEELNDLQEESFQNPLSIADLRMDYNYYIKSGDSLEAITITDPKVIYDIINRIGADPTIQIFNGYAKKGADGIYSIPWGHDLSSFNVVITTMPDINGEVEHYNLWQLESVYNNYLSSGRDSKWKRQYQKDLDALDDGVGDTVKVITSIDPDGTIHTKTIVVDKTKVIKQPYQVILPGMYSQTFGLKPGDRLSDIKEDKAFFIKRQLNELASINYTKYQLYLIRANGQRLPIRLAGGRIVGKEVVLDDSNLSFENGELYRVNPDDKNKKIYKIPYILDDSGRAIPQVKVYRQSGTEFLVVTTEQLTELLNTLEFDSIQFNLSKYKNNPEAIDNIVNAVEQSTNPSIEYLKEETIPYGNTTISLLDDMKMDGSNISLQDAAKAALEEISDGEDYEIIKQKHPILANVIDKGIITHTSFLATLWSILSRTPAQSHQSFMTMECVDFDNSGLNSVYVSRMQLFLQGSDYDIDKASIIGYEVHNGKFVNWSPYFNMQSNEGFNQSVKLPFPTGKAITTGDIPQNTKSPYDIMVNTVQIRELEDGTIVASNQVNGTQYQASAKFIDGQLRINTDNTDYQSIRALLIYCNKLHPNTKIVDMDGDIYEEPALGIDSNGIYNPNNIDPIADISDFMMYYSDYQNDLSQLATVIRVFNAIGVIPQEVAQQNQQLETILNNHNFYFKNASIRLSALKNYIAVGMRETSANLRNLIQGQSGIDTLQDSIKSITNPDVIKNQLIEWGYTGSELAKELAKYTRLSSSPAFFGKDTILSRIRTLTLTLSGKDNTGICAAAMKTFEAMTQYQEQIINSGTEEQQDALLSKVHLLGKDFLLIANAQSNNELNVKSDKLREALKGVDNDTDFFLIYSVFLSLSTDNAKDPVLTTLNADPKLIGVYLAGFALGIQPARIADLMLSDTGMIFKELLNGNVFDDESISFNRLTEAINFIENPGSTIDVSLLFEALPKEGPDIKNANYVQEVKNYIAKLDNNQRIAYFLRTLGFNNKTQLFNEDAFWGAKRAIEALNDPEWSSAIIPNRTNAINNIISKIRSSSDYRNGDYNSYKLEQAKQNNESEEIAKLTSKVNSYNALKDKESKLKELKKDLNSKADPYLETEIQNEIKQLEALKAIAPDISKAVKAVRFNPKYAKVLNQLGTWVKYKTSINNDWVLGFDGSRHKVFNAIKKLDAVNSEMSSLRTVLGLNQGLPTTIEEQLSMLDNIETIISNAYSRAKMPEDSPYKQMNGDDLRMDLHRFLTDKAYQQAAIEAYEAKKVLFNPLSVLANVMNYNGYLNILDLLIKANSTTSFVYRTVKYLNTEIIPKMSLTAKLKESSRKQALTYIYTLINNQFLYKYPDTVFNNIQVQGKSESIKLGQPKDNAIFKEWVETEVFPKLLEAYPNNAFLNFLTQSAYSFNYDHKKTINLAQSAQLDMKDVNDVEKFDAIKQDLNKLQNNKHVIDILFLYNLICYNGMLGSNSLTMLFEDIITRDASDAAVAYNKFLSELDRGLDDHGENLLPSDETTLMKAIAPVGSLGDLKSAKYIYVIDPETKQYTLCAKGKAQIDPDLEVNPEDYDISIERDVISERGYHRDSTPNIPEAQNKLFLNGITLDLSNADINKSLDDVPIKYIKDGIQQTKTIKQIKEEALNLGWSKEDVDALVKIKSFKRKGQEAIQYIDVDTFKIKLNELTNPKSC